MRLPIHRNGKTMNGEQQKEFLRVTAWLRPWTRRAVAFSMKASRVSPLLLELSDSRMGLQHRQSIHMTVAGMSG